MRFYVAALYGILWFQGIWLTSGNWTISLFSFTAQKLPNFRRCHSRVCNHAIF